MRARAFASSLALAAVLATILVAVIPELRFAYRSPSLHVAIETAAALIASLAAFLVVGRFRERRRAGDLVLASALAVLAVANLAFLAVPSALGFAGSFTTWATLTGSLSGASLLAVAAFAPERSLVHARRAGLLALGAVLATEAGAASLAAALRHVDTGIPAHLSPAASSAPLLVGHTAILGAQAAGAVLLAAAAAGFARRADRSGDTMLTWFAAAAALGAVARVNYLLFPSRYSEWVYTGDGLRLAMYLLLLIGAAREIQGYWRRAAEAAVLEERRRIARELHDGMAQELAFIAAETTGPAAVAAERALDESRRAIAALTRPMDEPLGASLVQAAEEVAQRFGVRVRADVDRAAVADHEVREQLIRIVREAVTNAGRHGRARGVTLELSARAGLRLRIQDDGSGFDPAKARGGFGLISMRERAEALGGEFTVGSRPGRGVAVEVALP